MGNIAFILAVFLAPLAMLGIIGYFIYTYKRYGYLGNTLKYIIFAYLICVALSAIVNLNPLTLDKVETVYTLTQQGSSAPGYIAVNEVTPTNVSFDNGLVAFFSSFFDALKMMTLAFDRGVVSSLFANPGWIRAFGVIYIIACVFALATTSISVILFRGKSILEKAKNFFKSILPFKEKEYFFIFSDPKSAGPTKKLGEVLRARNHIVIMYVPKSSLKTQEGTEYRDMLISNKFDVRSEGLSKKLCSFLFKTYFSKKKKVTIYGLFSNDDASFELATNFKDAIIENDKFIKAKESFDKEVWDVDVNKTSSKVKENYQKIKNFRVFVTYHDYDMDLANNFSGQTLHIVNTLSQYDMVSSEFLLKYPINKFLDLSKEYKNNDTLNVSFFGFGKINRPIFEKMTYAYQTCEDNTNKVHYHIYDKRANEIVEQLMNEYCSEKVVKENDSYYEKPRLYHLDGQCDDKDLTSYEILKNHFEEVKKDKNRFNPNGFEIFVVSAAKTNQDIQICLNLRKVLLKEFSEEQLAKTYIFVRISDKVVAENLISKHGKGLVPIIVFGEDTNMQDFITKTYNNILEKGRIAYGAYNEVNTKPWHEWREKIEWLKKDKQEVLENVTTIYSLEPKLDILGYKVNPDGSVIAKDKEATKYDVTEVPNYPPKKEDKDNPIYKMAALEHNRWLATVYIIHKYGQADPALFFKANPDIIKEGGINTKQASKTKHICITTNKGLEALYNDSKNTEVTGFKGDAKAIDEHFKKLTFGNDVYTILRIFKSMK